MHLLACHNVFDPARESVRGRSALKTLHWSVFSPAKAGAAPHPCSVLTPYPSPRAFIAATTATLAAAVVK